MSVFFTPSLFNSLVGPVDPIFCFDGLRSVLGIVDKSK